MNYEPPNRDWDVEIDAVLYDIVTKRCRVFLDTERPEMETIFTITGCDEIGYIVTKHQRDYNSPIDVRPNRKVKFSCKPLSFLTYDEAKQGIRQNIIHCRNKILAPQTTREDNDIRRMHRDKIKITDHKKGEE